MNETNGYVAILPDGWREAYAITHLGTNQSFAVSMVVIKRDTLVDGYYYVRGGYAKGADQETGEVVLQVGTNSGIDSISLAYAFTNGIDVKSISTTRLYYKLGYQFF